MLQSIRFDLNHLALVIYPVRIGYGFSLIRCSLGQRPHSPFISRHILARLSLSNGSF